MGNIVNRMLFDRIEKRRRSRTDINDGVTEYKQTEGAVLVDVREADEFRLGHIPGAVNIPLSSIRNISASKTAPLFVYCLRGSRSNKAVRILSEMGYQNVRSIGGINRYKGMLEK